MVKEFPPGSPMPYRAEWEFYSDSAAESIFAIQIFDWVYYPSFHGKSDREQAPAACGSKIVEYCEAHPEILTVKLKRVYPC